MKKKLLVCLLALALMVTAGVFAVQAETPAQSAICPHCQKAMDSISWTTWSYTDGGVAAGHYYLVREYAGQTGELTIPAGVDVCLDLRGKTYFAQDIHPFSVKGTLTVMDTEGDGYFLTTGSVGASGSFAKVHTTGTLNILGGTISRIAKDDVYNYTGGLVYIDQGTMKMSGGALVGGTVKTGTKSDGTTKIAAQGGNIYMNGGKLELTGGAITGGVAKTDLSGAAAQGGNIFARNSAQITISNGVVISGGMALRTASQHAYGGNIYVDSSAVVTISDGAVENGYADEDGGNIYVADAQVNIGSKGAVTGGHAYRHGGNIDLANAKAVLTMQGGSISGGVAGGYVQSKNATTGTFAQGAGGGGNIYVYKGALNLTDCNIAGDIRVDGTDTAVTLAGAAKIGLGKSNGMILHTGVDADVSALTDGAEIFVHATDKFTTAIAETEAERILGYFKGAVRTGVTLNTETYQLVGAQGSTGYCPHCYDPENPATVTWYTGFTPTSGQVHRYLAASELFPAKTTDGVKSISSDIVLDLNGFTFYCEDRRICYTADNVSFAVLDSIGGGRMLSTATNSTYNKYGGLVDFYKSGTFTLYSGIMQIDPGEGASAILGGGVIFSRNTSAQATINGGLILNGGLQATGATGGGNIYMISGNTLTVNAGIIRGGNAGVSVGGNIYNKGTTNIAGGVILNGAAVDGGNLYTTGSTTISGGTIYGGVVADNADTTDATEGRGGNLYATGATTVSGGRVAWGNAATGGNLYLTGTSNTISGGTVAYGVSPKGGNLYVTGTAGISGTGAVAYGWAGVTGSGGNIYVTGSLNVSGGTVVGGAAKFGGNIDYYAEGKTQTISGGLVIAGLALDNAANTDKEEGRGGNLYINTGSQVTVSDNGVISRGIANHGGGNAWVKGTLKMTGGQILGGRTSGSSKDGGSVYIEGGKLDMAGGMISGGYCGDAGGNVYMSSGTSTVVMSGGTITNGYGYVTGGNIHANNGKVTISGGVISNGKSGRGGNVYINYAASGSYFTIDGVNNPQIINGNASSGEGGNIYFYGYIHQSGSPSAATCLNIGKCTIENGRAAGLGKNIYINQKAFVKVLASFDSTMTIYFHDMHMPTGSLYGGMLTTSTVSASGAFTGKLILENLESKPLLFHKDGGLQIAAAALVKGDTYTWFADNASMLAAYGDGYDYMISAPGELELTGGTYVVDLAGKELNITGSGTVYGMDSANDTYDAAACGKATFVGEDVKLGGVKTLVDGKTYFAIADGNTYTFHRMGMDITSVSLRPSAAGMYYSALWQCDEVLANKVEAIGVAVSLAEVPTDNFEEKYNCLYTYQEGFENGATGNGVLISGILNTDRVDKNSAYGSMPIYAAAYVTMDGKNYTGAAENYSLQTMLKMLSDRIYEYYMHAEKLQSFMEKWDDYGLTGESWKLDFQVPEAVAQLQTAYAGTTAYQGELHDHAATGGTSDGHNTLSEWLVGMKQLDMDFATIVDHKQYLHMELPEWDNQYFIGGTELAVGVSDLAAATQNKAHINIIFYDPMDLKAAVEEYDAYDSKGGFKAKWYADDYSGTDADKLAGGWHFEYLFGATAPTKADMAKLAEIVRKHNGVFVHVHPKSGSYIKSSDPLDYWYADYTGLEVFYTYKSDRNSTAIKNNYKLWKDLLLLGKKVWATAGNDEHAAPANKALTTIYSPQQNAKDFVERVAVGNFTAGHVGVQMVVGEQVMGYETDFTGKDMAFRVGDFHSSVYDPTHTYKAVLIADENVVDQWEISCEETFYHHQQADASVHYYRVEVYDVTTGDMLALGNPIWNTAAG